MEAVSNSNIARFLISSAKDSPDMCALKVPDGRDDGGHIIYKSLTFNELYAQSSAVALSLQSMGVQKGKRVLVMVKPGLELIQISFALFMIGAVPVIIDPGMGLVNFLQCVKRSRPEFLVGIPFAIRISRIFFAWFWSLRKRIKITPSAIKRAHHKFTDCVFDCVQSHASDLAAILFTSGSTGYPKGVLYEHGMFEAQVNAIKDHYGIQPGEIDMPMLPIFALFNPALGVTTVVPEINPSKPAGVDAKKLVQAIHQNKITTSFGSPTLWWRIGYYCNKYNVTLPSLKRILMAGAPVSPKMMWLFKSIAPNAIVHTPYGATESLPLTSISSPEVLNDTWPKTEAGEGTCVGKSLPGIEIRIIEIEEGAISSINDCKLLDQGEIGEIIVKGQVVTRGYDRLEEATEKAKISDGDAIWHRMGDAGYLDDQGRLWFCGRIAERVVLQDKTLFTDKIEPLFNGHAWVYRSALISCNHKGNKEAAIVVQPTGAHWPQSEHDRKQFVFELKRIADKHQLHDIRHFYFRKDFPVDVRHNAKIHRLKIAKDIAKKN